MSWGGGIVSPWGRSGGAHKYPPPRSRFGRAADGGSLLFHLSPGLAAAPSSKLTVSSGLVTSAADEAGGSIVFSNARLASLNTGSPIGGRATIRFGHLDHSYLYASSGGITGAAPHAIWCLARPTTADITYAAPFASFGAVDAAVTSTVGGAVGPKWWGGGGGRGAPVSPAYGSETLADGTSGTTEPFLVLLLKTYDGTTERLYVDGTLVASGNATLNIPSAAFGITPWLSGWLPTIDFIDVGWMIAVPSLADRAYLVRWALHLVGAANYPPTRSVVHFKGDSLTLGTGASNSSLNYPSDVIGLLSGNGYTVQYQNTAQGGWTTANIISDDPSTVDTISSVRRAKQIYVLCIGTNNISNGDSAATIIADITTIAQARAAAGYAVVIVTIPPRLDNPGGTGTTRIAAVNAWITGTAVSAGIAAAVADLAPVEATLAGQHATADNIHFNDAGYATIASIVAPVVQGLL
jgi:lysophospholipase L1-like esterase